jgi:hypothetical protein
MYELHLADVRARLFPGEYTLGRKAGECNLVVGNGEDKSIRCACRLAHAPPVSPEAAGLLLCADRRGVCPPPLLRADALTLRSRKHATVRVSQLSVADVERVDVAPAVSVCDTSAFGTSVDGVRVPKDAWTPLPGNCTLTFGTQTTTGQLEHVPLVACGGSLENSAYSQALQHASLLGVHLTRAWRDECTLALVPDTCGASVPADAMLACALYSGAPVVRASWLAASLAGLAQGKDPMAELDACAVAVTHPATGQVVVKDTLVKYRSLLQGVTFVFTAAATASPAQLCKALAPWDAALAWVIRAAGGMACALGDEATGGAADIAVAAAAQGGAASRGILLLLPDVGLAASTARLRGTQWERAVASTPSRVLGTLLTGVLGTLQVQMQDVGAAPSAAPGPMAPPPPRKAGGAGGDDSDTDDEGAAPSGTAPAASHRGTAARVVVATQSGAVHPSQAAAGFQPFSGGARAKRDREEAHERGVPLGTAPPATAPKVTKSKRAAPKGHNAALAMALQMGKDVPVDEPEEEDNGVAEYRGADAYVALIVRPPTGGVAAPTQQPQHGVPNFKRFRKVPVLPSSASHYGLIVAVVDETNRNMDPDAVEEHRQEAAAEVHAQRLFNGVAATGGKGKTASKAAAKKR